MPSVFDSLSNWVHKTSSTFAALRSDPDQVAPDTLVLPMDHGLIYRLRQWPDLPVRYKTADVYRTLSLMSTKPVNRRWFLATSRLNERDGDKLIQMLIREGALETIDPATMAAS